MYFDILKNLCWGSSKQKIKNKCVSFYNPLGSQDTGELGKWSRTICIYTGFTNTRDQVSKYLDLPSLKMDGGHSHWLLELELDILTYHLVKLREFGSLLNSLFSLHTYILIITSVCVLFTGQIQKFDFEVQCAHIQSHL